MLRATQMSPVSSTNRESITAASPTSTRRAASSWSRAPMSIHISSSRVGSAAILLFQQMRGLLADDADDVAVSSRDAEALTDDNLVVPAAEWGEPEEALLVDVGDDEADLVDVPGEQHFRSVRALVRSA